MILCCGEALIDMIPGQSLAGEDCFVPKVGGAVFNTAVALGRLGNDVGLFTGLSNDLFGSLLEQELQSSQVKSDYLVRMDQPTSLAFVHLNDGQAQYHFYTENASDTVLTDADCPSDTSNVSALFFGGISLCTDPTASTLQRFMAREAGDRVIMMDPNIRPAFISDETAYRARLGAMMALCDVVKLSDEDLAWLSPKGDSDISMIAQLPGQPKGLFLITKGSEGVSAYHNGEHLCDVAAQTVTVADTVGAGDTFNAGVLSSLSQQESLTKAFCAAPDVEIVKNALAQAVKVAAITVSRVGANPPWAHELS